MSPPLATYSERMFSASEGESVSVGEGVLNVENPRAVPGRSEAESSSDVTVTANIDLGQVGDFRCERILDAEVGGVEKGNRDRIVAVAKEPGAEFIDDSGPEDVNVCEREGSLVSCFLSFEPCQRIGVDERVATGLIREVELAAELVRLRQLMIDVDGELVLTESCWNDGDHLAAIGHRAAVSGAVDSVRARRYQIRSARKLGVEQRVGNRVDRREIDSAIPRGIPDGRREPVDSFVGAVVREVFRHPHRVTGLVHE